MPRGRPSTRRASLTPSKETNPQLAAAEAEKHALRDAMLLVYREENHHLLPLLRGAELAVRKAHLQVCQSRRLDEALQAEASG
jgi:hypothetical protein